MTLYSLPLLVFVASPGLPGSLATQLVRGAGCVLVTATVVVGLQSTVPSGAAAGRVFGLAHSLVMVGTSAGALLTPVLLGGWGLESTLELAATVPVVGIVALLPALRRFDRTGAAAMVELEPRVAVLRQLTLFQDASRSTLFAVADSVAEVECDAGDNVVVQGEPSDALYVLVVGSVDVFVDAAPGGLPVRVMTGLTYFGEIGLIHHAARTATVVAREPCTMWQIPAATFLDAASRAGLSGALTEGIRMRLDPSTYVTT